jgi:hypothetical protein
MTDHLVLELSLIEADEDLQPRVTTDHNVSHEYGLAMARGDVFPPIDVFWDGETYWLADGFHRYYAAEALGLAEIECIVHEGSRDDALWFTCSANAKNGLHRNEGDLQLIAERALFHPRSCGWSDPRIAEHINCSPSLVFKVRQRLVATSHREKLLSTVGKDGVERVVGSRGKAKANPDPVPAPETDAPATEDDEAPEQMDIEGIPGVKPSGTVVPLIDPKWDYLSSNIDAVVKAHANLPAPGIAAANFPERLAHSLDIEDVEAIAKWWAGFVPLWRARQPAIQQYISRLQANAAALKG